MASKRKLWCDYTRHSAPPSKRVRVLENPLELEARMITRSKAAQPMQPQPARFLGPYEVEHPMVGELQPVEPSSPMIVAAKITDEAKLPPTKPQVAKAKPILPWNTTIATKASGDTIYITQESIQAAVTRLNERIRDIDEKQSHTLPNSVDRSVKLLIHGPLTALKFFEKVTLVNLGQVGTIRVYCSEEDVEDRSHSILEILRHITRCSPARNIEDVPMEFIRQPQLSIKQGQKLVGFPHFLVTGLLGQRVSFVILQAQPKKQRVQIVPEKMNGIFGNIFEDRPRVNFMERLPLELRMMIYDRIVPEQFEINGATHTLDKSFQRHLHVCRQMANEVIRTTISRRPFIFAKYYGRSSENSHDHHDLFKELQEILKPIDQEVLATMTNLKLDVIVGQNKIIPVPLAPLIQQLALIRGPICTSDDKTVHFLYRSFRKDIGYRSYVFVLPSNTGLFLTIEVIIVKDNHSWMFQTRPVVDKDEQSIQQILQWNVDGFKSYYNLQGDLLRGEPFPELISAACTSEYEN
ncbi:hypothetical protein MMC09_000114 [Bachmanniomyces sp. S44760]|nr:hypothetical protein [Bachmanniomyces sp. S44760]